MCIRDRESMDSMNGILTIELPEEQVCEEVRQRLEEIVASLTLADELSDFDSLTRALSKLRDILTSLMDPPRTLILKGRALEFIVKYLAPSFRSEIALQRECVWCLTNLAASPHSVHLETLITAGVVNALHGLVLDFERISDEVLSITFWALANLAGDPSYIVKNTLLSSGLCEALAPVLTHKLRRQSESLRELGSFIYNLARCPPKVARAKVLPLLDVYALILREQNCTRELNDSTTLGLYSLVSGYQDQELTQELNSRGLIPLIIRRLEDDFIPVVCNCLLILSSLESDTFELRQSFLDANILMYLESLLCMRKPTILKKSFFIISFLAAGTESQIEAVLDSNVFAHVKKAILCEDSSIAGFAMLCLTNAAVKGNFKQKIRLFCDGMLELLFYRLEQFSSDVIIEILHALNHLLELGTLSNAEVNPIAEKIDELGYYKKLESLQGSPCEKISQDCIYLIGKYFDMRS
eukprot:TRINITY_DN13074_c0_g2_i2.p1 TRINITY_DN13074_c0_g2~~TRINITY_DN13074_c0_g2_i2.p1  ORF type:complete len:469 (+),score=36.70 TRINITY_DN13074_c0_g2_i2:64-1470(+)